MNPTLDTAALARRAELAGRLAEWVRHVRCSGTVHPESDLASLLSAATAYLAETGDAPPLDSKPPGWRKGGRRRRP